MALTGTIGCPWEIDDTVLGSEWDSYDQGQQERAIALASATLTRLCGYRVGGCPVTVRPCKRSALSAYQAVAYWDVGHAGWITGAPVVFNGGTWVESCGCRTDCACTVLCSVELPGPVGAVQKVMLDGVQMDPDDYLVDGNHLLYVGAGDCVWPTCQDVTKPDTEVDTFSVTYLNGYPVDALGSVACAILALEYARAATSNTKCRLPTGVTSIVRQGISIDLAGGAFPNGLTGLQEVDTYIALWNPTALRQQTRVWSPDLPRTRVR